MTGDPVAAHGVVVTGGGTSGHVLPAVAIMDRLVAAGWPTDAMHHVGTRHGIDARLLATTPYESTLLDVTGLQRSLSMRNVWFLPRLVRSCWQAVRRLRRLRPAVVVNVGGFASMPASFAARVLHVPLVVVSYDMRPGLVSRVAARWATSVAAAFPNSSLPQAHLTGAPLRPAILAVDRPRDRPAARERLDVPEDRFLVVVTGGSLGAKTINDVIHELVARDADRRDLFVHHVAGDRWLTAVPPVEVPREGIMYRVIGYDERMPDLYAAADLMIARAGASTVAEIAATGTPAVLVPWPGAAENHQLDNARTLSNVGGALLLEESQLDVESLSATIDDLVASPDRLQAIGEAAWRAGSRHRDDSLIDLIRTAASR